MGVRQWICCSKHFQRNVTDPEGPANFLKLPRWNVPFIKPFRARRHVSQVFCLCHGRLFFLPALREEMCQKLPVSIRPLLCWNISQINVSDSESRAPSRPTLRGGKRRRKSRGWEDNTPAESSCVGIKKRRRLPVAEVSSTRCRGRFHSRWAPARSRCGFE